MLGSSASIPSRIGRYAVDRPVGGGGMSRTFRCTLDGMGGFRKLVLVKMLEPERADDRNFVEMFLDEARLSARLDHPNIGKVFEVGEQDGIPCMAMEYVAGPNLAQLSRRLRDGGFRHFGHLALLVADVARGLSHAHRLTDDNGHPLSIVHRDVSLGNIIVAPDGSARLIDFGIASWLDNSNITEVGMIKGKLHYMAPEQLYSAADFRVDLYQLGVCLYWLTAGRPPFHHDDPVQIWRQRMGGQVPRPSARSSSYPDELERIVLRALERDPARRFASAGDLCAALESFCAGPHRWRSRPEGVARWIESLFTAQEMEDFRTCGAEQRDTDPLMPAPAMEIEAWSQGCDDTLSVSARADAPPEEGRTTVDLLGPRRSRRPPPAARPRSTLPQGALSTRFPVTPQAPGRARLLGAGLLGAALTLVAGWLGQGLWRAAQPDAAPTAELPQGERDQAARIYLDEARRLAAAGDPEGAVGLLGRALAEGPADPALLREITRLEEALPARRR